MRESVLQSCTDGENPLPDLTKIIRPSWSMYVYKILCLLCCHLGKTLLDQRHQNIKTPAHLVWQIKILNIKHEKKTKILTLHCTRLRIICTLIVQYFVWIVELACNSCHELTCLSYDIGAPNRFLVGSDQERIQHSYWITYLIYVYNYYTVNIYRFLYKEVFICE
jgi:hypothetical protein